MSVANILLREVQAAGGTITARDGRLVLSAPAPLTQGLIDCVREAKSELLALLAPLDTAYWREYFNERAAIAEYDGRLSRGAAERDAFEECIMHWLDLHPPAPTWDKCAYCASPVIFAHRRRGSPPITINLRHGAFSDLHAGCHKRWLKQRREKAINALMPLLDRPQYKQLELF